MRNPLATGSIHKDGQLLKTVGDWHGLAPPKRNIHWKDGRSAKENARAWITAAPHVQPDIAQVLTNCPDIGPLRSWSAEPEARVRMDSFGGEPPNIDLLLVAEDDQGRLVVAIEAKADECFGKQLADQYRSAQKARRKNPRSKAVARIDALLDLFAIKFQQSHVPQLRYQLLTATAAVLAEAKRRSAERAVLIVHEFQTPLTAAEKLQRNADDLDRFLATVLQYPGQIVPGDIVGPVPADAALDLRLYVGKPRTAA